MPGLSPGLPRSAGKRDHGPNGKFSFPVMATWLGHTEAIAEAHYWQTTEAH
ncbi:MAG TPA: hypothetical protein PLD05_04830 [Thermogutta sp.]|nr:hypothetical protein [Thermogutta sp.]